MAKYFLRVKTFSRGNGSSVTRAAAYRAGERIHCARSGAVYDYTDRRDVVAAEIVLPSAWAGRSDMRWARDRSTLWNAAQNSGRFWNTRMAREVLVILPPELSRSQRGVLARGYARDLADRYEAAVDLAVHDPREGSDWRHHHAHFLMTSRVVGPGGLGGRTTLELSGTERHARGLGPSRGELLWMRQHWAAVTNSALKGAGLSERVDHRSYRAQGRNLEPKPFIPAKVFYGERRAGRPSEAGARIRAQYRERLAARAQGADALATVVARQRAENRAHVVAETARRASREGLPHGALTREQVKEKQRAHYRAHLAEHHARQLAYRRAHREELKRKQHEYRSRHLMDARRRDRERYERERAAMGLTVRPYKPRGKPMPEAKPVPSPLEAWAAMAGRARSGASSSERAARHWASTRQGQSPHEKAAAIDAWRLYRTQAGAAPGSTRSRDGQVHEGESEASEYAEEQRAAASSKPKRSYDVSR